MRIVFFGGVLASALLLAGCNGQKSGGEAPAIGARDRDACATLGKDVVAKSLSASVVTAEAMPVRSGDDGTTYSQCSYKLDDSRMLVFGKGHDADATLKDQLDRVRGQLSAAGGNPSDLPGIGKAGLWVASSHMMYVFLGDGDFVSATLTQFDPRKKQTPEEIRAAELVLLRNVAP